MADEMLVIFGFEKSDCSSDMTPYNMNFSRCGFINVDVNGSKKPNTIGKDIFSINILPNRLIIEGANPVDPSKVCQSGGNGWDCGVNYLSN